MFLSAGLFHQQLHSHLNEFAAKKTQTSLFHRSHHVPDLRHFWFLLSSFQTSQQIKTSSWVFFQEVVENIVNSRNTVRAKRLLDLVVCLSGIHVELGSVLVDVNRNRTLLNILCVFWFQAEDRFRNWSQTACRPRGASHPGLDDAHQYLHTGTRNLDTNNPTTPYSISMLLYWLRHKPFSLSCELELSCSFMYIFSWMEIRCGTSGSAAAAEEVLKRQQIN